MGAFQNRDNFTKLRATVQLNKVREGQLGSCIGYYRRTHDLPCSHEVLEILLQTRKL